MEAANLAAFLKFGKAKTSKILCYLCKKIMGSYDIGGGLEQNGACAPPGPGLKPPLTLALSLTVIEIWSVFR